MAKAIKPHNRYSIGLRGNIFGGVLVKKCFVYGLKKLTRSYDKRATRKEFCLSQNVRKFKLNF